MYNTNLVIGSGMAGLFRCKECHMNFQSQQLLGKHKTKFCVGRLGDPDDLQLRRGFRSVSPPRYSTPDDRASSGKLSVAVESTEDGQDSRASGKSPGLVSCPSDNTEGTFTALSDGDMIVTPVEQVLNSKPYTDSMLVNKKISQLKQLKDQRTRKRDLIDFEERVLLDQIAGKDRGSPRSRNNKGTVPLSKHRDIRDLQMEYERLRDLENSVAKQPVRMVSSRAGHLSPYSRGSDSSMSIHIVDDDYRRPNQDTLRSLAENHGRQMEYLQLRNKDLEKQREDIMKRLEGLGRRPVVPQQDNTADLLRELREQEIRNQRALDDLKRQLYDMNNNRNVNIMDVEIISRNIGRSITQIKRLEDCMKVLEEQVNEAVKKYNITNPFQMASNPMKEKVNTATKTQKEKIAKEAIADVIKEQKEKSKKQTETDKDFNEINRDQIDVLARKTFNKGGRTLQDSESKKDNGEDLKMKKEAISDIDKNCDMKSADKEMKSPYLDRIMTVMKEKKLLLEKLDKLKSDRKDNASLASHSEKPVYPMPMQAPPPPPPPPQPEQKKNLMFPVYYGKSLVAEISAIRQAYLHNGGNDPDVLAQMAQMLADAQAIEDQMNQKPERKSPREKPSNNNEMIKFMEMENERLNQELRFLHEQKLLAQNRGKSDKEDELEREIRRLQRDHLDRMYALQKEMDDLKMLLMMERNKPAPAPTIIQQPAPPTQQNVLRESTPWLLQKPYVEVEPMPAYDQYSGFVIFYDFLQNLDPTVQATRVIVGLHSSSAVMGEPTILPTVYAEPATRDGYNYNNANAVLGAKQPVPKCPPEADLGIVAEMQASGGPGSEHDRHSLITRAWTKIPLFDNQGKLIAGRFKIPLRNVPIKPFLHVSQVERLPKYGDTELYYRIVNMRDAETHSMHQISAANHKQYSLPMLPTEEVPIYTPKLNIPPPPTGTPKRRTPSAPRTQPEPRLPSIQKSQRSASPPQVMSLQDMSLGFQVDRVKNSEPGEGKVRLTAYVASTGKIVQSNTSPVTCSTTAVRSNFKYGYHVFGQQEATFQEVEYQGDMIMIARFYLKKRNSDLLDEYNVPEQAAQEPSLYDDETLVAWAALPLVQCDEVMPSKKRRIYNPNTMTLNQGTHTMPLYLPPVPEPNQIPLDTPIAREWERYGRATLRVYVFQGYPRPGSLTPSDISETEEEDTLPEFAWLPLERKTPPKDPYLLGDGFDVYIDGCRYLPDSVTFTKIAGRILDRRYDVHGKDINTGIKLDSDVYNPVYEDKTEFRETSIPPTATMLLKVYTIDNFYKTLTVVGYATLNVFVETGTERQPTVDKPMQVSLNEGAHQLRLYSQGPNGVDPFSENCLRDSGVRIIPCGTVLVRVVKIARGAGGKALESSKVPQGDWLRMGLWQPRPRYTDRVYYSSKCMPTKGETRLFHNMMKRTRRSIREVIALVASAKESFLRSDKNMEEYIRNQLTKAPDAKPLDQDLNFICKYSPKNGMKVAVDSAVNLPWSNFTHVHMCLNPPAAFYLGAPHATYDKLTFTDLLDVNSTNTSPAWKDGFKHFPRRNYHRYLTMVIHLQEIQVTVAKDNYKYGLLEQAWTAVQIFTDKYCNTQAYQLPLFAGSPSQTILKQLAREPCKEWMERNIRNSGMHLLEGSSIFVRVSDARRDDELQSDIAQNKLVEVNTDYIPVGLEESYSRERPGKPLESLVPIGKTPEQFVDNLKTKFKSLVYKLYEEGNVGK